MDAAALALCMTAFDFGVVYADLVLPKHQATAWDDKVIAISVELAATYTGQDDLLVALLHDANRKVVNMTGSELVKTIKQCEGSLPAS